MVDNRSLIETCHTCHCWSTVSTLRQHKHRVHTASTPMSFCEQESNPCDNSKWQKSYHLTWGTVSYWLNVCDEPSTLSHRCCRGGSWVHVGVNQARVRMCVCMCVCPSFYSQCCSVMMEQARTGSPPRQTAARLRHRHRSLRRCGMGRNAWGEQDLLSFFFPSLETNNLPMPLFQQAFGQSLTHLLTRSRRLSSASYAKTHSAARLRPRGLSVWHHAAPGFLHTLMHCFVYAWCQCIML